MATTLTGRFVWFDDVSNEVRKAQAFFGALFHWRTKDVPMPGGSDEPDRSVAFYKAIAGFEVETMKRTPYVKVANTGATVDKAKKLGADVKNVETVPVSAGPRPVSNAAGASTSATFW